MSKPTRINQKEYTHYVVFRGKIASGWYNRSDAQDDAKDNGEWYRRHCRGEKIRVLSRGFLVANDCDPDNNANWHLGTN